MKSQLQVKSIIWWRRKMPIATLMQLDKEIYVHEVATEKSPAHTEPMIEASALAPLVRLLTKIKECSGTSQLQWHLANEALATLPPELRERKL